jgi:hypothetical protein
MAITKILYRNGGLAQAIQYITNPDKTDQCVLVDHFNCDPGFAYQQMMNTKRRFHKTDANAIILSSHLSRMRSHRNWRMKLRNALQQSICEDMKP